MPTKRLTLLLAILLSYLDASPEKEIRLYVQVITIYVKLQDFLNG